MRQYKFSTKTGKSKFAMSTSNEGFELSDVYSNYSRNKERAWQWCWKRCHDLNGYNFHICSHNSFCFTIAFEFTSADGNPCVMIETASNEYCVVMDM